MKDRISIENIDLAVAVAAVMIALATSIWPIEAGITAMMAAFMIALPTSIVTTIVPVITGFIEVPMKDYPDSFIIESGIMSMTIIAQNAVILTVAVRSALKKRTGVSLISKAYLLASTPFVAVAAPSFGFEAAAALALVHLAAIRFCITRVIEFAMADTGHNVPAHVRRWFAARMWFARMVYAGEIRGDIRGWWGVSDYLAKSRVIISGTARPYPERVILKSGDHQVDLNVIRMPGENCVITIEPRTNIRSWLSIRVEAPNANFSSIPYLLDIMHGMIKRHDQTIIVRAPEDVGCVLESFHRGRMIVVQTEIADHSPSCPAIVTITKVICRHLVSGRINVDRARNRIEAMTCGVGASLAVAGWVTGVIGAAALGFAAAAAIRCLTFVGPIHET